MENLQFKPIHVMLNEMKLNGENVIQVIKKEKIGQADENTYIKLSDLNFHNGTVEVKVLSRLLPDAPEYSRGFIGLAFRINENNSRFESFYIRPTNGMINDPIRKNRAFQYFSYPKYTFSYFRDQGITDFEGPALIALNEWITLKIDIKDSKGIFYINDLKKTVLVVDDLKLGADARGSVGIFVDDGTEGYFKDLKIKASD